MRVGLFIPCYIDQFYPQVAIATLRLLQKLKVDIDYPIHQTCCGQPMANSGFERYSASCEELFTENFRDFDCVVSPSGSCVLHIREHLNNFDKGSAQNILSKKIFELTEFLTDVLKIEQLQASFPHRVAYHASCHGLRGLHLSKMSELVGPAYSKPEKLLRMVDGLELVTLSRKDDCCGFGGTFCVTQEALSVKMGQDRISDFTTAEAEYVTASDMSCLMHLEGITRRGQSGLKILHIAEILNHEYLP